MVIIQIVLGLFSLYWFYCAGTTRMLSSVLIFGIPDLIVLWFASIYAEKTTETFVNGAMAWPRYFVLLAILNIVAIVAGFIFGMDFKWMEGKKPPMKTARTANDPKGTTVPEKPGKPHVHKTISLKYTNRRDLSIYGLILGILMLGGSIILNAKAKSLLPATVYGYTGTSYYVEYSKCYAFFNIVITIASILVLVGALWKSPMPPKEAFWGFAELFIVISAFAHNSTINMSMGGEELATVQFLSRWLFDLPFFLLIPLFLRRILLAVWDGIRSKK